MANAYINQGQKPRAWKVLQEAAKCDYDNWKVWDNIMVVSTDCAHFEEIIRAYHRILDIKNAKHVDADVLKILVHAITNDLKDNYDRSSKIFKKSAKELFGRLTSENSTESILWELYAGNNSLFKNKWFRLDEMFQQNASRFKFFEESHILSNINLIYLKSGLFYNFFIQLKEVRSNLSAVC